MKADVSESLDGDSCPVDGFVLRGQEFAEHVHDSAAGGFLAPDGAAEVTGLPVTTPSS